MKCNKCGKELEADEVNTHDSICAYAFNLSDYENLIPCEICNELVDVVDYEEHIRECVNEQFIDQIF